MVPLLQGAMASGKSDEDVVAPGSVTTAVSEVGQLVSCRPARRSTGRRTAAVDDGATATGDGAPLAGGDRLTDSPLTIVTVSGRRLPENSASFG